MFAALILLFIAATNTADAVVLRVPSDFPTVQSALNQLTELDTVLVGSGTYNEALIAPPLSFFMIGEIRPDSGTMIGATIDIGPLAGADSLTSLWLFQGVVVIESLIFRNSYGAHDTNRIARGGISTGDANLFLRDCLFDSVAGSASGGIGLVAENCLFLHMQSSAIMSGGAPIHAANCLFSGDGFWQVTAGSNSRFINCIFERNTRGHFLAASGDSIIIDSCTFRDYGPYAFDPVDIIVGRGCALRNTVFSNINIGPYVMRFIMQCDSLDGRQLEISNVLIDGYEGGFGQGGYAMYVGCHWDHAYQNGMPVKLEDCVIRNGILHDNLFPLAIEAEIPLELENVEFADLEPLGQRVIRQNAPAGAPSSVYRECSFERDMYAIQAGNFVDARWSWWGDSTGPTEPAQNPNGQGASIQGPVEYIPWLTSWRDTSEVAVGDHLSATWPSSHAFTAYPNPFNSTTTLRLEVSTPGQYTIELFDVTGRVVATLFKGRAEGALYLTVAADHLASGVYFAALQLDATMAAVTKLMLLK